MNAIWVATDWHLWDIKHKPQHPFRTNIQLNAMRDECVDNIADGDIFIHLGDLCDPASPDAGKLKEFISNIPGYKVLCKGNYDTADDSFYLDAGFDEVCEICKIHNIIFSHKPVKVAPDEINIHGHLHTEKMSCLGYQHINAYATNIGEDQIPHIVELDDLLASATVQKDYPKDHWVIDQKYIDNINKYTSLDGEYFNHIIDLTDRVSVTPMLEASDIIDFDNLPTIRSIAQGRTKRGHLVTLHAQQFAMGNVKYVVSTFKDVLDAAIHIAPYAYDKEQIAKCRTANELIAYFNTLNNAYSTSNGYSGNFYAFANANVSAHFFDKDQIYSKLIPTDLSEDQFAEYISNAISEMDNMLDILLECIKTNYALFGLALSDVNEINVSDIGELIDNINTNPPKGFIETKADGTKIIHFGKLAKNATMYISKTAQGPAYSAITPNRYLLRANEYKYIIITHGLSTGNRNEWACDSITIDNKQFTSIPAIVDYIIKVKENGNYNTKILIMTCNPNMYKFSKKYHGVEYGEYNVYAESAVEVLSPRKELIRILFDWDKYCNTLLEKFDLLKKWTHAYYYDITAAKELSEHYSINSIAANITTKNIELTFASNGEFLLCTDTLIEAAISIILAAHDLIGIINDEFTMSESGNYHWYENIVNGNSGGFLSESIDPFVIAVSEHLEHSRGYESLQECINEATIRLIYGSDRVPKINPIFAHDRTIDTVNFSEATDTLQWGDINEVIFDDVSDTEYWEQDDEYEPSHKKKEPMADGKMFVDESTYYRYTYDMKSMNESNMKHMILDFMGGTIPKDSKVYHLSSTNLDNVIVRPTIPKWLQNKEVQKKIESGKNVYEEYKTPRVCFSKSIMGCIAGMYPGGDNSFNYKSLTGKEFFVHIPEKELDQYKTVSNKSLANNDIVFDAFHTKEMWITEPVKMICIGKVRIDKYLGDGKRYNESYFKWSWVEKYDKDNMNESTTYSNNIWYHLVPKGTDMKDGIISPEWMLKHGKIDLFRKATDKYRNRMVNGWDIYPGRQPASLSDKEVADGLNKFRGPNGTKQIYLFRYPPTKDLGANMASTLEGKDIYEVDLSKIPDIIDIDYGNEGSFTGNRKLTKKDYNISKEEYFKAYDDNTKGLLFATINHISIVTRSGRIHPKAIRRLPELDDVNIVVEGLPKDAQDYLKRNHFICNITMDRPIGYIHHDIRYPINYGYIKELIGGDGEEQDVYILGETKPLKTFRGKIIARIIRENDNEEKWVACAPDKSYTEAEIIEKTAFMEQYFKSHIIMMDTVSINHFNSLTETVKEPMTKGAIKNIFAKFKKKGDSENHSLKCSKELVNIKKAYTEWYMGFTITNMDSEQAKDLAEEFAYWCQQTDNSHPRTYMHITKDDIIKEFGSRLKGEDIANNYLMFPCRFAKNPGAVKTRYGLRYFTDIIDNAIRRVLYDNPKYKYPNYIMTDNIKAGHKYLTGKDMDIQNEATKEYMRTDDNHPMTRDEKTESFRKYGLNPVGQDPELAKTEKERELERKTEARKKQLAKARKIKKRKARVRKIKSKLPGVKNEEAETVAQASVNIDNDEDKNPIWGDSIRFFNHPDQYTETNINETFADYKFHLDDHITFMDHMNENSSADDSLYPVYVMVMHSGTLLANTIKKVTNSHFSHCTISFDSSMKNMYSFGRKADVNPFVGGFTKDSITNSVYQKHEVPYALYVVPVTKDELDAMKKRLDYFITNRSKFSYDFTGLIKNYFGIADNPEYRYFCSRFVADILNAGRPKSNPYVVEPSLMRPEDFTTTNFAIYVTGGYLASYKPKFVDDVTKRILRAEKIRRMKEANANIEFDVNTENPYSESVLKYQLTKMDESVVNDFVRYLSSFKIHLDNDGNVLISRREYDQLSVHFHNSLKIIKACENAGNVEGVKEELYKIKYMIDLIQSYYLTPKSKNMRDKTNSDLRKEMMDLRSVMINAMGQHIKYVTLHDPKWNFQQGYAASKYSNDQFIPKSIITAIGKTVVTKL